MVELKGVSCFYPGEKEVLHDISLTIQDGERIALIGPNGAGKSTLMKSMVGLVDYKGEICINGVMLSKNTVDNIRKETGYVMQNSEDQLFMPTVMEDMMFGLLNYGLSRKEAGQRVNEILQRLNIEHLKDKYIHKLSGGEKKIVAIGVVIALMPKLLILDEPSSTLDPFNRRIMINILNDLSVSKLIATHDLDMALDTCDRVIIINNGIVVADGDINKILTDKDLLISNRLELPYRFQ